MGKGKAIDEDDELPELEGALETDDEVLGLDDAEELALSEIDDGPEEVGLDVETLGGAEGLESTFEDGEDDDSALDDAPLELESELEDEGEEQGWTEGSEGSNEAWDDDLLDDESELDDDDDGGLEGVDDPLLDGMLEVEETTLSIDGDDEQSPEEELERLELELG